ncbi:MAG: hypothetical protein CSA58_12350 [Micrococcales bacterium]|nr:MAG: hypothetical protein CSB46_07800 [Micrococcales bacterium]PIE25888.1 MAG: hypothetical protein CSA58_12350 [Micrococcales bacterium]
MTNPRPAHTTRRQRAVRSGICLVAALVGGSALAGCGSPSSSPESTPSDTPVTLAPSDMTTSTPKDLMTGNGQVDTGPTDLTITVRSGESAKPTTWTLTCHPAGGSHPDPEKACAQLAKAGGYQALHIPREMMCAQVFGGPATATLTGTLDGNTLDVKLGQDDSCRTNQWNSLSEVLGSTVDTNS